MTDKGKFILFGFLSYLELTLLFDKYGTFYSSDLLKALAWHESGWQQFTSEGTPYGSPNSDSTDWGIRAHLKI